MTREPARPDFADCAIELLCAFDAADKAGFGFRQRFSFYAIPGLEDAAADFIESYLAEQLGSAGMPLEAEG
ncbi:hypothetical protein [Micropruina sp.]|uniref:hypothetical protein n=1 Tax=Micropruina sp. TaxID=2737536 RepID=UPI0039E4FB71